MAQNYKPFKTIMSLPNSVADGLEHSELPVTVSAVVMKDSIGYPRRVVEEDGETHDGEHSNFDEAYDFACALFETDEVGIEKDEEYVWFTK